MDSLLETEQKYFTKDSIKRAKKYTSVFQYGCHLLDDKEIEEVLYIMAKKIQKNWDNGINNMFKKIDEVIKGGK